MPYNPELFESIISGQPEPEIWQARLLAMQFPGVNPKSATASKLIATLEEKDFANLAYGFAGEVSEDHEVAQAYEKVHDNWMVAEQKFHAAHMLLGGVRLSLRFYRRYEDKNLSVDSALTRAYDKITEQIMLDNLMEPHIRDEVCDFIDDLKAVYEFEIDAHASHRVRV